MKKIAINGCHGGFSLSHKAFLRFRELGCQAALDEPDYGEEWPDGSGIHERIGSECFDDMFHLFDLKRDDPLLIQVIEEMGKDANGSCAELRIIEIPDNVKWEIDEYDGWESVDEKHRTWN